MVSDNLVSGLAPGARVALRVCKHSDAGPLRCCGKNFHTPCPSRLRACVYQLLGSTRSARRRGPEWNRYGSTKGSCLRRSRSGSTPSPADAKWDGQLRKALATEPPSYARAPRSAELERGSDTRPAFTAERRAEAARGACALAAGAE